VAGIAALLPREHNRRWLALGNLVNMTGTGASLATLVVFLADVKGLSLALAASVLAAAGFVGILGAAPVGVLIDRVGAKIVAVVTEVVCALAVLVLLGAPGTVWMVVALTVRQLSVTANTVARATVMGRMGDAEDRVALRAYQRAVTNVGFGAGTLLSAAAVAIGTTEALVTVMCLDAASFLFGAFATARLHGTFPPGPSRDDESPGSRPTVLRDWRYVLLALLNAVCSLNGVAAGLGVSFWVVYASDLPSWAVSVSYAVNTVLVVLLQVRFSQASATVRGSATSLRSAGLLAGVFCVLLAISGELTGWVVWVPFLVAAVVITVSEMWQSAAGWTLSYEFANDRMLGAYQAVWHLTNDAVVKALGPLLVGLAVAQGAAGFGALATAFCVLALATPAVVSALGRSRRPPGRREPHVTPAARRRSSRRVAR